MTNRPNMNVALAAACLMFVARVAAAQAFVPPVGEGSVTVAYQNLLARGHLDLNGDLMTGASGADRVYTHAAVWEVEYGVTSRWALHAVLPFITSRYDGDAPHRPQGIGPPREWDDGTYHGTFQDFRFGARYQITSRPVVITPLVEVIIPSHHYPSIAHAAVGKDLRALVMGGAAGAFLDAISPRLYFQAMAAHAVVQEVLDIRANRSYVNGELGYFITPRLVVRFLEAYQLTHHGLDVIGFLPMTEALIHGHEEIPLTGAYRGSHDRLLRSNYLTLGGGVGFALADSVQVFANAVNMVWGENVHPLRGITIGVSTQFRTPRASRQ